MIPPSHGHLTNNHFTTRRPNIFSPVNRLHPVWTVDTGSLFVMSCSAEEFFTFGAGLTFCIKDFDSVSKDELVGQVSVSQSDLLEMNGERVTLDLKVPRGLLKKGKSKKLYTPKLNIRVRQAQPEDKAFIKTLNSIKRSKKEGVHASASFVAPVKERVGMLKRETKVVDGVTLVSQPVQSASFASDHLRL
jgi:hypothetical protein